MLGRKHSNSNIHLLNLEQHITSLIYNKKLFHGCKQTCTVLTDRHLHAALNILCFQAIANIISANKIINEIDALNVKLHSVLHPNGTKIWNTA